MKRRPMAAEHRGLLAPAAVFGILSDPHRLAILVALTRSNDAMCVCDFADLLSLNQSTVSHHLRLLRQEGLVVVRRRGTWSYYSLPKGLRERLHGTLDTVFEPQRCA
jgi:DNA-binding transcriptional ArsR family regulator